MVMDVTGNADVFLNTLGANLPDEAQMVALVNRMKGAVGNRNSAAMLAACCFILHEFVRDAPIGLRPSILAGILRLIDPPEGTA